MQELLKRLFPIKIILVSFLSTLPFAINSCSGELQNKNVVSNKNNYLNTRDALIESDWLNDFHSDIKLSQDELELNNHFKKFRMKFLQKLKNKNILLNNKSFSEFKTLAENSELFQLFRKMPKGGLLHSHSGGLTRARWIVNKLLDYENCYVFCGESSDQYLFGQLVFIDDTNIPKGFIQLNQKIGSEPSFYNELINLLVLERKSLSASPDYWVEFEKRFTRIISLFSNREFFIDYYLEAINELVEDNVQHLEIRFIFDPNSVDDMMADINFIISEIDKKEIDFTLKIIYSSIKFFDEEYISSEIEKAVELKRKYPNIIVGFDLVAEEDRGNNLLYYYKSWRLLDSLTRKNNISLPVLLHAGETNSTQVLNLYDAVLLNSARIGHGLNLVYYPELIKMVKEKNILVEINPLSNQILGYVDNLKNHPGRILLKHGIQCSISSDDPGVFGYEGLSYDFWSIFIFWELDLRSLKKLVFNSINYASLNTEEKNIHLQKLESKWNKFVSNSLLELRK